MKESRTFMLRLRLSAAEVERVDRLASELSFPNRSELIRYLLLREDDTRQRMRKGARS